MEKHVISVQGMSCNHCKNAVEKAAKSLSGVAMAEVSLAANNLTVEFDPSKVTLEEIKKAVAEEGYTV